MHIGCFQSRLHLLQNVRVVRFRLTGHYLFGGKTAKDVLHHNRKCEYTSSFDGLSIKGKNFIYLEKSLLLELLDNNPNTRISP